MSDQAFHAAQRFRQCKYRKSFDELTHLVDVTGNLETQHGAEAGLLLLGYLVSGMRRQARVMNF